MSTTRWKIRSGLGALTAAALVALAAATAPAWADDDPAIDAKVDPAALDGARTLHPAEETPLRSRDDILAEQLADIDWFAGTYLRDSTTVVLSTRPEVTTAELSRVVPELAQAGLMSARTSTANVIVEPARYTFAQLNDWKKSVEMDFLALPGAVSTDLAESTNRIVLGYDPTVLDEADVWPLVERAAIAEDAVEVRAVKPEVEASLRDRSSALAGGLQIVNSDAGVICTLGLTAVRDSVVGFVTNDHCTRTSGSSQGDRFYQPDAIPAWIAGTESVDPALWSGGGCPSGRQCRYSDAAFVTSDASAATAVGWAVRMDAPNDYTAWTGNASPITSAAVPVEGLNLVKIGRTTGETSGSVTDTCINVNASGTTITRLCQDRANFTVQPGDSGSPVLANDFDSPIVPTPWRVYGVVWGGSGTFSWTTFVSTEIGSLSYLW